MFHWIFSQFDPLLVAQELRVPFAFAFKFQKVTIPQPEFVSRAREIAFPKSVPGKQTQAQAFQVPKRVTREERFIKKEAVQIPLKVTVKKKD